MKANAEELRAACSLDLPSSAVSAFANLTIGTNSIEMVIEGGITQNPAAAELLAKLGGRLLTAAHRLGHPLQPLPAST